MKEAQSVGADVAADHLDGAEAGGVCVSEGVRRPTRMSSGYSGRRAS
jgi:hypothetical protein